MLLYGSVALFFFGLTVVLLTAFAMVLFGKSQCLPVLGIFTALYFVAGLLAWSALSRATRERSKLFSTSLTELENDRNQLAQRP